MSRLLDAIAPQVENALAAVREKFPGAELVDVRPPPPAAPGPEPAPSAGHYSLGELAQCARDAADQIRRMQTWMVEAGLRPHPLAAALARADKFDALGRLADRVRADAAIIERLRRTP